MGKSIHEIINSLNDENAEEIKEQLKEAADVLHDSNKQLFSRAKKAEGFEWDGKDKIWTKKEVKKEPEPKAKKSDESDNSEIALKNSQKALLNSLGYKHEDDHKYILGQAEKLKMDISEVLNDDYHKAQLKKFSDTREALAGMPKGKGSKGSSTSDSVDYWIAKGQAPNDPELREEYFKAREKKEANTNMFSDELFTSSGNETKMAE